MKTIQLTIDEDLLEQVDEATHKLGTTRSAFTREALKKFLREHRMKELDRLDEEGYQRHPVRPGEFEVREEDLAWGDDWPWEDA
ncbi:MAG: ribbon-helix-helix protein, CopG family [Anaerolineae bacterium]